MLTRAAVVADMRRVADWQLAHPSKHPTTDWTQAPYYLGLLAANRATGDAKYFDAVVGFGEKNGWKPGPLMYHADDHAVGRAYIEVYGLKKDPRQLAGIAGRFDGILAKPAANADVLDFEKPKMTEKWTWCDSLYMSPPTWVALAATTDDNRYLDFADREFWRTYDYLYDTKQHLFFRDSTYFKKKEANGASVFWGRGNGWVIAGLADILKNFPKDHPSRPKYERLYREMAEKLVSLQQADGSWHPSLLDPVTFDQPEMSSTAFNAYGIAWGVNNGLLDRVVYEPALRKAWLALTAHILPSGALGSVQPIGADPRRIKTTDTEVYGTGAFLLFGEQMHILLGSGR